MTRERTLIISAVLTLCFGCASAPAERTLGPEYDACKSGEVESCWTFAESRGDTASEQRDALVAYQFACHLEHPQSCRKLGELMGESEESARSVAASRQGCEGGDLRACVALADQMPRARAEATLRQGCEQDIGEACQKLAGMLGGNWRVRGQLEEVHALSLKACELGTLEGCVKAGQALVFGSGVERDTERGVALLEKACEAGVEEGCLILAKIFEDGMGVEVDRERASTYGASSEGQQVEPRLFASTFILHADGCARSVSLACFNAAEMRLAGDEVERNITIARDLYREACQDDVPFACTRAGDLEPALPGQKP